MLIVTHEGRFDRQDHMGVSRILLLLLLLLQDPDTAKNMPVPQDSVKTHFGCSESSGKHESTVAAKDCIRNGNNKTDGYVGHKEIGQSHLRLTWKRRFQVLKEFTRKNLDEELMKI